MQKERDKSGHEWISPKTFEKLFFYFFCWSSFGRYLFLTPSVFQSSYTLQLQTSYVNSEGRQSFRYKRRPKQDSIHRSRGKTIISPQLYLQATMAGYYKKLSCFLFFYLLCLIRLIFHNKRRRIPTGSQDQI